MRPKLRYAHQGGSNPPVIVVHGNQTERVPDDYRRYLAGVFREAFDLQGTPVRIELKGGTNPYDKDRKKTTTPKQAMVQKRERRLTKDRKRRTALGQGKKKTNKKNSSRKKR